MLSFYFNRCASSIIIFCYFVVIIGMISIVLCGIAWQCKIIAALLFFTYFFYYSLRFFTLSLSTSIIALTMMSTSFKYVLTFNNNTTQEVTLQLPCYIVRALLILVFLDGQGKRYCLVIFKGALNNDEMTMCRYHFLSLLTGARH